MTKDEIIEKYLRKELITKNLASYISYYQISLGRNVFESIGDVEMATKKLIELNLTLNPNEVIITIFIIIISHLDDDNISANIDRYIREKAFNHSLEDFVKNDHELLNKERYSNAKKSQIIDDSLFNHELKMQYLREFPIQYKHYNQFMTDDFVATIVKIIKENFL